MQQLLSTVYIYISTKTLTKNARVCPQDTDATVSSYCKHVFFWLIEEHNSRTEKAVKSEFELGLFYMIP